MSVVVIDNGNDAAQAIGLFPRNYKLISWLAIHTLGLPTVDGVIFDTWGEHVAKAIHRFCGLIGTDRLLLRSDKADEAGTSPRGGFLVDIQNVHEEVLPLIEQGRTLFLLEPKSPFSDLYSVGVLAWPGDRCMVIEVVGPGFDASDLKRGDLTPHERFRVERDTQRIAEHTTIAPDDYLASWQRRFEKVAIMLARGSASKEASATVRLADAQVRQELDARGEALLLEAATGYAPIPTELAMAVLANAEGLGDALVAQGLPGEPLMASMSYWGRQADPIYWDVVWPHLKYEGEALVPS